MFGISLWEFVFRGAEDFELSAGDGIDLEAIICTLFSGIFELWILFHLFIQLSRIWMFTEVPVQWM